MKRLSMHMMHYSEAMMAQDPRKALKALDEWKNGHSSDSLNIVVTKNLEGIYTALRYYDENAPKGLIIQDNSKGQILS